MRYIKKISTLLLICFLLIPATISARQIKERKIESYTFSYYVKFLDGVLIPQIEEYIDEFNFLPYCDEKGDQIVKGVSNIIKSHLQSNNILIPPGKKYPVSLVAAPLNNKENIIYYVNIILPLVEYNEKGKITSILMISRNFFCGKESFSKKQIV